MDKAKNSRNELAAKSLKDQVNEAIGKDRAGAVWIRKDGAVCFGDECVVLKPNQDGSLLLQVDPSSCGQVAGEVILEHLIKTAGKGVTIQIPAQVDETGQPIKKRA